MTDIIERLYAVPETGADPELIEAAAAEIEQLRQINAGLRRHANGVAEDNRKLRAEIEAMKRTGFAPGVPEPMPYPTLRSRDWYYAEGWNDCRAEVLCLQAAPCVQTAQENNDAPHQ